MGTPPSGLREWCATTSASIRTRGRRCPRRRAALWSAPAGIVNSQEGRTHMMREHRNLIVWPSLIAAGLLAAACTDQPKVSMAPNRPAFWVVPPPAQCPTGKWTGGGRIDPPSNHDALDADAVHEAEFFAALPPMTGKFTFGFNVFLGQDAEGNCVVTKGQI